MFRPEVMKKINLFLMREDLKKASNVLYELKLVEFFELEKENFDKFEHKDLGEQTAYLLKLRSSISILKNFFTKKTGDVVNTPVDEVLKNKNELDTLEKDVFFLEDEIKRAKILKNLGISKEDLNDKDLTIGFVPEHKIKNVLSSSFRKFKFDGRIYFKTKNKNLNFTFKEFYLPKRFGADNEAKLLRSKDKLAKLRARFEKLANGNLELLQLEEVKLSKELAVLEVRNKFSRTKNVVVLSGYVIKSSIKKLRVAMEEEVMGRFEMEILEADDKAPIQLNNTFASKFESILKMYSLPKYGEFDPTILMFFVFPFFFGFILGDVIYGLISLIVFTFAKRILPKLKDFIGVLQLSALVSIIFGFIYGEYMGFEPHGWGLFHRMEHPETLLVVAVIFGLIHINLGLIIGFFNELKNPKKALTDKFSWFILEAGAGFLAYGVYASIPMFNWIGSVLLAVSVILIYMGHGIVGVMEIPSFFTNVMSYARLMAVGLSSVAIAILVNEYSMPLFNMGILGIVGGILLFSIGHIFNIVLGNFEGFLHTLRLHYVEFFTKFYSGDGREFVPFGTKVHEKED